MQQDSTSTTPAKQGMHSAHTSLQQVNPQYMVSQHHMQPQVTTFHQMQQQQMHLSQPEPQAQPQLQQDHPEQEQQEHAERTALKVHQEQALAQAEQAEQQQQQQPMHAEQQMHSHISPAHNIMQLQPQTMTQHQGVRMVGSPHMVLASQAPQGMAVHPMVSQHMGSSMVVHPQMLDSNTIAHNNMPEQNDSLPPSPQSRRLSTTSFSPAPSEEQQKQEPFNADDLSSSQAQQTHESVPTNPETVQTDCQPQPSVPSSDTGSPMSESQAPHSSAFTGTFSVPPSQVSYTQATSFLAPPMASGHPQDPLALMQSGQNMQISLGQNMPMPPGHPLHMPTGPNLNMPQNTVGLMSANSMTQMSSNSMVQMPPMVAMPPGAGLSMASMAPPRLMMVPGPRPVGPPPHLQALGPPPFQQQAQFLPPPSSGPFGPRFPGPQQPPPPGCLAPAVKVGVAASPPVLVSKVMVPWGWKRLLLADAVVYFSPSGIQLKTMEEVQEYLSTEGTCKCGLQCPLTIKTSFDFNPLIPSEGLVPPTSLSNSPAQCIHQSKTLALAQIQSNTGFAVRHYHNPTFNRTRDGVKRKVKKKKKPFSGVLVSQMLAAREAEKQRINEIIAHQKALEAHKSPSKAEQSTTSGMKMVTTQIGNANMLMPTQPTLVPKEECLPNLPTETPLSSPHSDTEEPYSPPESPEPVKEEAPVPGTPPAHLNPRMVHPAMLGSRSMMNLGQMMSQAPDSPVATSPGPMGQEEKPRGFSLAEAMQAARKLNLEQEPKVAEEQNLDSKDEGDPDMEVSDSESGRLMIMETDQEDSSQPASSERNSPEKEKGWDDMAKNIEIRRLSSTDDGNKVIESTFHSPDKDIKKNPMMNLFNIVSGMEPAPPPPEEPLPRGPQIPTPMALGALRPQLRGRKSRQYSTLPPLPHSPPPWVLGGQAGVRNQGPPGAPHQIVLAPQMVLQGQPPPQQVMQLVQTVNGPVLVPVAAPQQQMVQLQQPTGPLLSLGQRPPTVTSTVHTSSSPQAALARGKKPLDVRPQSSMGAAPLMMAPGGGLVSFQSTNPPVSGAPMMVAQAPPGPGAQLVVGGQAMPGMQGMILMPQPQGIMYQQMPDGSLVQMQGQVMPQGQILVPGPGQVVPGAPPSQLLVTQGGLVQGVQGMPPLQPGPSHRQLNQVTAGAQPRKRPPAKKMKAKKKTKAAPAEDEEEQEQDETDTSFEEPQPSTSKSLSPRSSIQSNKVDSSGLNATPPHQKDAGDFEQLREKSSESEIEFRDLLNTTEEGDEREEDRAETSASNFSLLEEKIEISEDDESAPEEDGTQHHKYVSSSSKKKKKRKKKTARDPHRDRSRSSDRLSPPELPVVPSEPRDFRMGDLVWGPAHGFPSWPGKLVRGTGERREGSVWVCWFGTRDLSQVEGHRLKTLSEGLEAHHRERKKSRRGRKMNASLEKAIQEAMAELD